MKMFALEVSVFDGAIAISQDDSEESPVVLVSADQAELLCSWIRELAELLKIPNKV